MNCAASLCGVVLGLLVFTSGVASASPLDSGNWTQVGYMAPDDHMFGGNCNLSSTGCTYGPDASSDFWIPFPETYSGQANLFITGDEEFWATADYSAVASIVSAAAGVFTPNISWSDAGIAGVSIGTVSGNVLQRSETEDPWVTLRGSHCAHLTTDTFPVQNDCNLILWGEVHGAPGTEPVHKGLKNASGGVEVYVSSFIPEPNTALLFAIGLIGMSLRRRDASKSH